MIKSHTANECHGCFITKMFEMDCSKQPQTSPNWYSKEQNYYLKNEKTYY